MIIYGASDLGCTFASMWDEASCGMISGFIDDYRSEPKHASSYSVLGGLDYLRGVRQNVSVVICIGDPLLREFIFRKLSSIINVEVCGFIHPAAYISSSSSVSKTAIVFPTAFIGENVEVGDNVIIHSGVVVSSFSKIESHSLLSPNVSIASSVRIQRRTVIGIGASILPELNVGCEVVVGAGAVVTKNIADKKTVKGVPAL